MQIEHDTLGDCKSNAFPPKRLEFEAVSTQPQIIVKKTQHNNVFLQYKTKCRLVRRMISKLHESVARGPRLKLCQHCYSVQHQKPHLPRVPGPFENATPTKRTKKRQKTSKRINQYQHNHTFKNTVTANYLLKIVFFQYPYF